MAKQNDVSLLENGDILDGKTWRFDTAIPSALLLANGSETN